MGRILLLGDERDRAAGIRSLLREDGHAVMWIRDVERWREVEREQGPELIVAAMSSLDPVLTVPARPARGFLAPLLLIQHDPDLFREIYLEERLVDRLESPFMAEEMLGRAEALIRVRRIVRRERWATEPAGTEGRREGSGSTAKRALHGLGNHLATLLGTRVPRYKKPPAPYIEVAACAAEWADHRDIFEPGHAERVTSFSALMADGLGLPDNEAASVLRAAMLHDIGKVALPVEVLRCRGPLADDQKRLIRTHPERGAQILRALDPDEEVASTILYHHERADGQGYYHMSGETVPRSARIVAVAEAFDAMTTSRIGTPIRIDKALGMVREQRGRQFDRECVDALVDALKPRATTIPLAGARLV